MKFLTFCCLFIFSIHGLCLGQANKASNSKKSGDQTTELTPYQRVSMYLGHSLFKSVPIERQSEILWGIKSVKPMLEIAEGIEGDFDAAKVEQKILSVLKEKAVQIDKENGHVLLFRIRGVWDKGKVTFLYTYDLDLVDKIYVSRDGQIKTNFRSIWNVSNMGYAGIDVYQNAMLINVESAVERFAISYYEQLDFDIISDTQRMAKQMYQQIRDGDEDILKLLADEKLGE